MARQTQVNDFLRDLKRIAIRQGVTLAKRQKNELAQQDLTMLDFQEEIMQLNYKNYCGGPESGKRSTAGVWIFGKVIGGEEYYIKLKIPHSKNCVVCLSFHPSEHSMTYPLR